LDDPLPKIVSGDPDFQPRWPPSSKEKKPLGQLQLNFGGMVLGWPPLNIVSGDPDFQPKWPPS